MTVREGNDSSAIYRHVPWAQHTRWRCLSIHVHMMYGMTGSVAMTTPHIVSACQTIDANHPAIISNAFRAHIHIILITENYINTRCSNVPGLDVATRALTSLPDAIEICQKLHERLRQQHSKRHTYDPTTSDPIQQRNILCIRSRVQKQTIENRIKHCP